MPGLTGESGLSGLSGLMGGYIDKVLGYGPIAYWPLYEPSGATAHCLVNSAQNGSYTGVTVGQTVTDSSGVTFTCPFFDGANDYVNVLSGALAAAFNGAEGSFGGWARVNAAAVWTDGALRRVGLLYVDANNRVILKKNVANSQLGFNYIAGGTNNTLDFAYSDTDWFHFMTTWSKSGNYARVYTNGAQQGVDQVGLGVWVGALTRCLLGADTTVPANVWHGWLAHWAVWDTPLTQPQIADIATV